jgi:hypothetical protein
MKFSEPYTGNGHPEPVRYGDLPLDFDSHDDLGITLKEIRELCLFHLPELYDLDPYTVKFYLSGGKGFHAIVPAKIFDAQDGDPCLPLIYKKIAVGWKEQFKLTTLDLSLYNMAMGKMFRLPNIRRENGQYKVPITLEELNNFSIDKLRGLTKRPRKIEDPL